MIYFLLYYGYKVGMSGTSFERAITDTIIQWNQFWAKITANLKDFSINFTLDRLNDVWLTFISLDVIGILITISTTVGIVFVFVKYAWAVFRYYSIQLDEGISPLTIEFIKKTAFAMLFVFLAPYIIINGFFLTTVVSGYAASQIGAPEQKIDITDDLINNHLSFESYCGDNVEALANKDKKYTSSPPQNNILTKTEYDLLLAGTKTDEDKEIKEEKTFCESSLSGEFSDVATFTLVKQKEGLIAYNDGKTTPWETNHANLLQNRAHINEDSSIGPIGAIIVTENDRNYFLVAMSSYFGSFGDKLTITLKNGTKFYAMIFDEKSQSELHVDTCGNNIYHGDEESANMLEFEMEYGKGSSSGNVLTDDWFGSGNKDIISVTNEMTITQEELKAAVRFDMAKMFKDGETYVNDKYNTLWSSEAAAVSAGYNKAQYTGENMGKLYQKYCSSFETKDSNGDKATIEPLRVYQRVSMDENLSIQTSISLHGILSSLLVLIFGIFSMINLGVRVAELIVFIMMTPFFGMQYISVKESRALATWSQELMSIFMSHATSLVVFYIFINLISDTQNFFSIFPILFGLVVVQVKGPSAVRAWSHNTGVTSVMASSKKSTKKHGGKK